MRIISTPVPVGLNAGSSTAQPSVGLFDTYANGKHLIVCLVEGIIKGPLPDGLHSNQAGIALMESGFALHREQHPGKQHVVAGVADNVNAAQRVSAVLAQAPDQALVILVCPTDATYSAAFNALGVDLHAGGLRPQ